MHIIFVMIIFPVINQVLKVCFVFIFLDTHFKSMIINEFQKISSILFSILNALKVNTWFF